ncbi:hypothetical protein [Pseudomonas monteilii]|uniref:LPD3 domain-containing protein n=1 Tax=Pseudomonas monteilii TaxID=76759 RepID=UPI003F6E37D0
MTDLSQAGVLPAIERARLSAELLQIRGQLVGNTLSPIERARASARALAIRDLLGAPKAAPEDGQAAFEAARTFYQEHLKGRVIQSVIGPVQINGTGWKKAKLGMKSDALKAKLIEHVEEILVTGTAGQRQAPHKVRTDDFVAFHFIQKQVRVDELLVTAGVTVAEDSRGNLFYNVSHEGREAWKAKENGATDYAGVGPRSDDADNGTLDSTQREQDLRTVEDTVADDDLNITILAVVVVEPQGPAANEMPGAAKATQLGVTTGQIQQKGGGVLVQGDPAALATYARKYLDLVKFTEAADGLVLTKGQADKVKYFPIGAEQLASGAVIYRYSEISDDIGVAVAFEGELSGIARSLPELKSLMAQSWGAEKYRTVFGEEADAADIEAYEQDQVEIAQRKRDNAQAEADAAAQVQQQAQQQAADQAAKQQELDALIAGQNQLAREKFERTVGAGKVENPIYQAYLDTLEELPTFDQGNSGFLGWAGIRAGEFERAGKGRPSTNKDDYLAYIREWADQHLADRVRAQRANTADTGRAPAGGVIGMNGEFYKGGTILPTTTLPKGASTGSTAGTGRQLVEPGVFEEPPEPGAKALFAAVMEFVKPGTNGIEPDATRAVAMVHYLGENGAAQVLAYCKAYNAGKRWLLPGETIAPEAGDTAPVVKAPEIIEYKTKRDKILRGIIRTDLTLAEAKAIDPYTWRMNGGYFIREKHLEGDTSAIQAAPVPVVLTPEQEAEKQERDQREALERQQKAVAAQADKLRQAGAKAIASGNEGMTADRKTNTSRRAGMAASAFARAANDEAEGQTLTRIADAIEVGAAGALSGLTSRTQLQELKRALSRAKSDSEAGLSYADQLARQGQPVGEEVIHLVRMPSRMVWGSWYRDAAREMTRKAPTGNSRLIAALTKMAGRVERWSLEKDADIAITRKAYQVLKTVKESWYLEAPMEVLAKAERLRRMGITTDAQLQDACRALLTHLAAKQEESAVAKAERAIIGQKVGIDFFPTPAAVAHRMAKLARIGKGDRVLEPSAGNGNLADAAAAAGGEVDVIEISSQLRDILTAKGYAVVDHDFMGFTPEQPYQAILMNPPFSKRQDAEHIMRAFGMLAAGGTLVAIAGEGVFFGSDKAAQHFRDWLDQHGAEVEKLEGGTFQDNALLAQTSANARLIVLRK